MDKYRYVLNGNNSVKRQCTLLGLDYSSGYSKLDIPPVVNNTEITCISKDFFYGFEKLTELRIPATVTHLVPDSSLNDAIPDSVSAIYVSKDNRIYSSHEGVLYNKSMSKILFYPKEKRDKYFTIPSTVTIIDSNVFFGNKYIENITIQGKHIAINANAFHDCPKLNRVVIHAFNLEFQEGAFLNCKSMENLEYYGKSNYVTEDSVLYHISSKEGRTLLFYPPKKSDYSYKAHPDTTSISRFCFSNKCKLHILNLPSCCLLDESVKGKNFSISLYRVDKVFHSKKSNVSTNQKEITSHAHDSVIEKSNIKYKSVSKVESFTKEVPVVYKNSKCPKNTNSRNIKYCKGTDFRNKKYAHPFVIFSGTMKDFNRIRSSVERLIFPDGFTVICRITKNAVYIPKNLITPFIMENINKLKNDNIIDLELSTGLRSGDVFTENNGKSKKTSKKKSTKHAKFKDNCTFNPFKSKSTTNNVFRSTRCPGARNPVRLWH